MAQVHNENHSKINGLLFIYFPTIVLVKEPRHSENISDENFLYLSIVGMRFFVVGRVARTNECLLRSHNVSGEIASASC